jgi:hypothetical protein
VETLFFNIQKLKIGNTVLTNIKGGVGNDNSPILLGQSALKQLEPWHIDTRQKLLRFGKTTKINKGYVSPAQKINRGEVLSFINYYISLHNHGIPSRTAALYAPVVDYLDHGKISKKQILAFKEAYMDRWQQIHLSLLRLVAVKALPSHPDRTTVTFDLAFKLYSDMEQQGERGQARYTLVLEKSDRSIRIISEKRKPLSRHTY